MTDNNHPITPPPELIEEWIELSRPRKDYGPNPNLLATYAARWGADQELEACCEWLDFHYPYVGITQLRAARRPKPTSLKEQALKSVSAIENMSDQYVQFGQDIDIIRRALEALDD